MNDCGIENHQFNFISDFQLIHDECIVEDWEYRFQSLSKHYNLVYTPPAVQ
jgi:hypothetical protein